MASRSMHRATASPVGRLSPQPSASFAIIAAILAVCFLIVGLDGWRTWTARTTEIADQKVGTANLARSLAQDARDLLDKADTLLVSLRVTIEADGYAPAMSPRLQHLMALQLAAVPALQDLTVFNANADAAAEAGEPALAGNIGDLELFQYHAAHKDRAIHIGQPIQGKLGGTSIVTLSRRIDSPDGSFGGVVLATFTVESLRDFYRTFDVGKTGFIGLYTLDRSVIARFPSRDSEAEQRVSAAVINGGQRRTEMTGNWQSAAPVDGTEHLGSFRRLETYPLIVLVGVGMDEVLAPWRMDALINLAIGLLAATVIATLGVRFVRQLRLKQAGDIDLQRSERKLRLLADNNLDLIVQLDRTLTLVYASPASEPMLGYAPNDLLGCRLSVFVNADDWQSLSGTLLAITEGCPVRRVSYRLRRWDGTDCWVEAAGRRLNGGEIMLVQRDVTDRRNAEMKLQASQRMETVGQLTAGLAHDLNNLLQAQHGALELLGRHVGDGRRVEHFAAMALDAAQHAAKLTQGLLSFSRQQVAAAEAIPVVRLLSRIQVILARTLGPRIILSFELVGDLNPILADPAHLEAALLSLALNARDAMPDGGSLAIEACNGRRAFDCPDELDPEHYVLVAVSDDGIGMDAETLAHACDPFYTTKASGKGSGLGLSMVQGFAQQSGGALRFSSNLGQGTRAELWLPRAMADEPPVVLEPECWTAGRGRILLVDDVAEVTVVVTEILEDAGFHVVAAASGEAALAHTLAGSRFDALVTDLAMPGMDGLELIHRARQSDPALPAVILTGYAESQGMLDLPPHVAVMQKPVSGPDLVSRVRDLVEASMLAEA